MTASSSRTLGAFGAPEGLPVAEFDAVNEQVSQRSAGDGPLRLTFASAWNGFAYRFRAALEHSAAFSRSLMVSSAPPSEQRYQQDHDLFAFVACALSAVECFHFAAYCIGHLVDRTAFPLSRPSHLRFYPQEVLDRFAGAFPDEPLVSAMRRCVESDEYAALADIRNVLSHRGTPPRQHFLSSAPVPDTPSAIPSNLADLSSEWRYDFYLTADCLEPYTAWLEQSVRTLTREAAAFTSARLQGAGNASA